MSKSLSGNLLGALVMRRNLACFTLAASLACSISFSGGLVSGAIAKKTEPNKTESDKTDKSNSNLVMVHESRPYIARTGAWQTYRDHIHLKAGQEKKQLVLSFINGAEGRPKLTDLKISLAGKPFATIKDFDESGKLSRNMTGNINSGDTLVTTEVFGPSGARMAWRLYSEKPHVASVQPDPYGRDDTLTVRGTNFSANKNSLKVSIAGRSAEIVSASAEQLQVKVPKYVPAGEQELIVSVDSAKSNSVKIKARPNIYWINDTSTSPSQPLTIIGRGFSKVASQNTVTISTYTARVVSATDHSLQIIVPEMPFPNHGLPITVTSNGVSSKEHLVLDVDIRVIPNMVDAPKILH